SDYELVSAHGNLTVKAGESYVHIHASLSGADFQVFGGHLFEAEVAVTAEVQITIFDVQSIRQPDQKIGLDLVCQFHKS
ncbi:MAG: DNA-binding protein, partial [Bdellovibrionales bacterium]|nr:DNA-binding protein [Bdellovibrionales bacterium]